MVAGIMKVLVTGGRDFTNVGLLWRALDDLRDVSVIIEGASDDVTGPYVGADYWSNQWAKARHVNEDRHHAEWSKFGRAAGPIRNKRMLEMARPDLVIGFLGGAGTLGMMALARAAGVEVRKVGW